jgi:hypothetical protein
VITGARGVVLRVLDVAPEDFQAVDLGRQGRGDGALGLVRVIRHLGRGAGRIGVDDGLQTLGTNEQAALGERLHVAVHHGEVLDSAARQAEQLMVHPLEVLADDMKAGVRQQVMNVRDPAGAGILDRDHGERGPPLGDRRKGVLEGRAGQRGLLGKGRPAGHVGIGPRHALEGDHVAGQLVGRWSLGHGFDPGSLKV